MTQALNRCLLALAALLFAQLAFSQAISLDPRVTGVDNGAFASLRAKEGLRITGEVFFSEQKDGVRVRAQIAGLKPGAVHGFHIHEGTLCEPPGFESALGHFNPTRKPHGGPHDEHRHAGDLGNVTADGRGRAALDLRVKGLSIGKGDANLVGRTLILHEKADDQKSQPTGDAGGRIACGVIELKTRN